MATTEEQMDLLLRPLTPDPAYTPPEEEKLEVSAREAYTAGFEIESPIENIRRQNAENFTINPDYDPFDEDQEDLSNYDPMHFVASQSPEETASIKASVDWERQREKKANSSGWGIVGRMVGFMDSPLALSGYAALPVRILPATGAAMGIEAINEAALQSLQYERTKMESALNIAGAGAVTAALGGAIKLFSRSEFDALAKDTVNPTGQPLPEFGRSIGAAEADPIDIAKETLVGGKFAETVAQGVFQRTMRSASGRVRAVAQRIAEPSVLTRGMQEGLTQGTPVELAAKPYRGRAALGVQESMNQHKAYKQRMRAEGKKPENFDDFNRMVGDAMDNGDIYLRGGNHVIEVENAAKAYRKIADDMLADLKKLGMLTDVDVGPSYFPYIYSHEAIYARYSELDDMLKKHFQANGVDEDYAGVLSRDTITNMLGGVPLAREIDVGTGAAARLKQRKLDLPTVQLAQFRERNAANVMTRYIESVGTHIEMRRRFPEGNLNKQFDQIDEEYKALIANEPNARKKKKLNRQWVRDKNDLNTMLSRVFHQIKSSDDPQGALAKGIRLAKTYNMTTQLGGIVFSSLPDMARPIMQYGLAPFTRSLAGRMQNFFRGTGKMRKTEMQKMGIAIENVLDNRASQMAEMWGEPVDKASGWLMRTFGKVTMFNRYTDMMENFAGQMAADFILRSANKVATGKRLSKAKKAQLARVGLDEDLLKRIDGQIGEDNKGLLWTPETAKWDDMDVIRAFESAVAGEAQHVIIRRGAGDVPTFMDKSFESLVMQYMSFAYSATNRMLVNGMLQQRDIRVMEGLLASVFLGSVAGGIKATLRGEDVGKWEESQWLLEGIDRSGVLGIFNTGINLARYGLALNGVGEMPSRYLVRSTEQAFAGPVASNAGRVVKIATDIISGEADEDTMKNAERLMPFWSNALHLREILEKSGYSIPEAIAQ